MLYNNIINAFIKIQMVVNDNVQDHRPFKKLIFTGNILYYTFKSTIRFKNHN